MEKGNEIKIVVPPLRFPEFQGINGWEEKKLEEIGNFIGGGTPNTAIQEYWDGGIPWYTPTEIKNGDLKSSNRTITEKGLKNSSAKLLPQGAILITTRATIGDVAISKKECTTNQGFQSLVVNDSESNLFWFYWIIRHKEELIKRASGSTFKEISKNEIINITSYSPKKQEQQKIAACLSSLYELIEATAQKVEALKEHKKGLMQRLFPAEGKNVPDLRFPEFRGTSAWEEKKLGNVVEIKGRIGFRGYTTKDIVEQGKGAISLSPTNITENGNLNFDKSTYISWEKYNESPEIQLQKGHIVLVKTGSSYGKSALVKELPAKTTVNPQIVVLKPEEGVNKYFISVLISHPMIQKQIKCAVVGGAIPTLSQESISKFDVLYPKKTSYKPSEQEKIANCLSSLDELIEATSRKVEILKEHKKGLIQQLFPKI